MDSNNSSSKNAYEEKDWNIEGNNYIPHTQSININNDGMEGGTPPIVQKALVSPSSTSEIIVWLVGLRGLAACLVLCHHVGELVHGTTYKNQVSDCN
ncbi:hypothetical protein HMI54_015796 [Coelomomyces lativittatus]|nr:hypothetical protein HMI56_000387 [Coelomomyces lativittatus]KAJ1512320.1 hypothetical protein HMI54_015796 [Coelomomyces lativittatus]